MVRALVAMLLAASAPARKAPAPVRVQPLTTKWTGPQLDMEKLRAATAMVDQRRRQALAIEGYSSHADEAIALLDRAQTTLGSQNRLAFPPRVSEQRLAELKSAERDVVDALALLVADVQRTRLHLAALESSPATGPAQRSRVRADRAVLDRRMSDALRLGYRISGGLRGHTGDWSERAFHWAQKLFFQDPETDLERLRSRLREWHGAPTPPLGAELNYVFGPSATPSMPGGNLRPAYLDSAGAALALEDTTQGREIDLSPEIVAKATALVSAKAASDFVRNQLRLEWYYGSLKGATETLREGRGNDADLAGLLIALLRAQSVPARYVRGTIELPVERLAGLMGLLDSTQASMLDAGLLTLPPATGDLCVQILGAAGVPYVTVQGGGRVTAVQLLHVWVEAYLPYSDYRGTGRTEEGRQWVAIEPSIPAKTKYAATTPSLDALEAMQTTAGDITQVFLTSTTGVSPLEFFQSRIQDFLAAQRPDLHYADVLRRVDQRPESLPFLPGTLPYKVVSVVDELAFLPDDFKHRVRIAVGDPAGLSIDLTLPAHDFVGRRALLVFKPATDADADVVGTYGSVLASPPALLNLKPAIRIEGKERALGQKTAGLGDALIWSLELLVPGGATRRVQNTVVVGNTIAIGLAGPKNGWSEPATPLAGDVDGPSHQFLYARAAAFANEWTEGEDELARILRIVPVRPTPSVVFVENQLRVDAVLGVRQRVRFTGLEVDADLRSTTPVELVAGRSQSLMRISGYQGSFLEAQELTAGAGVASISATSALQEAARQGVAVLSLTAANADAVLPQLQTTGPVLADLRDHLARGREVLIPQRDLTVQNWSGTGYIVRNPVTEEGGYFLAGGVSGGQTIISPAAWTDADLANQLANGSTKASQYSDTAGTAVRIVKSTGDKQLNGTAGSTTKIAVYVTTLDGTPVSGAPVSFAAIDGAQVGFAGSPVTLAKASDLTAYPATWTAPTGSDGRASIFVILDPVISHSGTLQTGSPNPQAVGLDLITARTQQLIPAPPDAQGRPQPPLPGAIVQLASPFVISAQPGAQRKMTLGATTSFVSQPAVEVGVDFPAMLTDQYGNPVANETVAYTQAPSTGAFIDPMKNNSGMPVTLDSTGVTLAPSLSLTSTTFGMVVARYVPGRTSGRYQVDVKRGTTVANPPYIVDATDLPDFVFRSNYTRRLDITGLPASVSGFYVPTAQQPKGSFHFPGPLEAQFFRRIPGAQVRWEPAIGTELGGSATITMKITNGNTVIDSQAVQAGSAEFWPTYDLPDGDQSVLVSGQITDASGVGRCCSDVFGLFAHSSLPQVQVYRARPGLQVVPAVLGMASTSDAAIGFRVLNPGSFPLYGKLVPKPNFSGDTIIEMPEPQANADFPGRTDLVRFLESSTATELFPTKSGTQGGTLALQLMALDPKTQVGVDIVAPLPSRMSVRVTNSADLFVDGDTITARVVLPVRNFGPGGSTEPVIEIPGPLEFAVDGTSTVTVNVAGLPTPYAQGRQVLSAAGTISLQQGATNLQLTQRNTLLVQVPPSRGVTRDVTIISDSGNGSPETVTLHEVTREEQLSQRPIGHTFVKDVNVVDGGLVKRYDDLALPGRGSPLAFTRTYANRSDEDSSLGRGWDHNYRSFVMPVSGGRYAIVGGDGSGQVFTCISATCTPQKGFHGTFAVEGQGFVFRSKTGVRYHYGAPDAFFYPARARLSAIEDPVGNRVTLDYGADESDHEVVAVHGSGGTRSLHFSYERPTGAKHAHLTQVELFIDRPQGAGVPGGVCLQYSYDVNETLSSARRLDGACADNPAVLRSETYAYQDSNDENQRTNLVSYTDPNGNTTTWTYYDISTGTDGRYVKEIHEPSPGGGVSVFTYGAPATASIFGVVTPVHVATVTGPRPGVPATIYRLNDYGNAVQTERPIGQGVPPGIADASWNADHVRVDKEKDACGRITHYAFDAFGNTVRKEIEPLSGGTCALEALTDGAGQVIVGNVVEQWAYDPAFSQPLWHIDAENRANAFCYDSNLASPVGGSPAGTALLLQTRRFRAPKTETELATACNSVAPPFDGILTEQRYCNVNEVACPAGAVKGDLVESLDGNRNSVRITQYDRHGYVRASERTVSASSVIASTAVIDDRGRTTLQSDSVGHATAKIYDGLDRPLSVTRQNRNGPSLTQTFTYYPAGQVHTETNGLGMTRTTDLDGLNRPSLVTEEGGQLPAPRKTQIVWDEAGNKRDVIDPRGVDAHTEVDYANRARSASLSLVSLPAEGLSTAVVGQSGVIATFDYDALGNKVRETDIHGHETVFAYDALYRAVRQTSAAVPGAGPNASSLTYANRRRFDRAGNKTRETDGNGHSTDFTYDFADRLLASTDPVGRIQRREYDANGNVVHETTEANGSVQVDRSTPGYDGLNRPLSTQVSLARETGPNLSYTTLNAYDDVQHITWTRSARGFVNRRDLDDLDRPTLEIVDYAGPGSPLARAPDDANAGAALGLTTSYEYDANGNRSATVDALGRRTEEKHDGLDRVIERDMPLSLVERFAYDGAGRVIRHTDVRGIVLKTAYDLAGREVSQTLVESITNGGADLLTLLRSYSDVADGGGLVSVEEKDANGHSVVHVQDALHREVQTFDALGKLSRSFFDARDRTASIDRKGYLTEFTFDAADRPAGQVDRDLDGSAKYTQSTTYDDLARTRTTTDRRGIVTLVESDGLGRVERTTRGSGADVQTTRNEYDAGGNVARTIDANGHATAWSYDGGNRRTVETRAVGTADEVARFFKCDAVGNLTEKSNPRTGTFDSRTTYDDLNRAVLVEDGLGNAVTRAFDAAGNVICEKQPKGGRRDPAQACSGSYVTKRDYDEFGKLTRTQDPLGGVHRFVYDKVRNEVARIDANGNLTTYEYSARNERIAEHQHLDGHADVTCDAVPLAEAPVDVDRGTGTLDWSWTYDFNGNVRTKTDPKGQVCTFANWILNRLENETWSSFAGARALPSLNSIARIYDPNGNLTNITENKLTSSGVVDEVTVRVFDGLDRLKNEARYDGKLVAYGYDAKGNRLSVTDPDQVATVYTYDAQDRLKTATLPEGITTYSYYVDSLQKSVVHPNGIHEERAYDSASRLTSIATSVSSFTYEFDANGNRSRQIEQRTDPATQALRAAETTTYGYDEMDRLTGVLYPGGNAFLYRLDAVGNRTGEREAAGYTGTLTKEAFASALNLIRDITGSFDRANWLRLRNDAVNPASSTTYVFDLNGNLVAKATATANRTFSWDARNTLTSAYDNGTLLGNYDYDRNLLRVKRSAQGRQVEYVLDDKFVLSEHDGSTPAHSMKRRYHYGTGPLAESEVSGASRFTTWLGVDAQGSITDATQSDGTVRTARQYDAWGQYRNGTAPGSADPKLGYTGHEHDPEAGLEYDRHRYRDPELGIFISRDPRESPVGETPWLHRYVYVKGNPLKYVDPDGFCGMPGQEECQIVTSDGRVTTPTVERNRLYAERVANDLAGLAFSPISSPAYLTADALGASEETKGKLIQTGAVLWGPVLALDGINPNVPNAIASLSPKVESQREFIERLIAENAPQVPNLGPARTGDVQTANHSASPGDMHAGASPGGLSPAEGGVVPVAPARVGARQPSLREQYMGRTPGKGSATGRTVIERMTAEGTYREGEGGPEVQFQDPSSGDEGWHPAEDTDMSHKVDAVTWWNTTGRFFGPKAPEVRRFMLDSENYTLEPSSINRSRGAKLGEQYQPPAPPPPPKPQGDDGQ